MSKLSFSFKKKVENKQILNKPNQFLDNLNDNEEENKIDYIKSIKNNVIESEIKIEAKQDLVIECKKNRKRKFEKISVKQNCDLLNLKSDNLDDLAKKELLKEALFIQNDEKESNLIIPKSLKIENNNDLPNTLDADYDKVHPDDFAMALLRGMGLKKEQINKVKPLEPQPASGGVGLGFFKKNKFKKNINSKNKLYNPEEDEEIQESIKKIDLDDVVQNDLSINGLVCIDYGEHKGNYGKIVSISDSLINCEVKLELNKITVTVPTGLLRIVSRKEYNKESKVLNKQKYEQYKKHES